VPLWPILGITKKKLVIHHTKLFENYRIGYVPLWPILGDKITVITGGGHCVNADVVEIDIEGRKILLSRMS
jgi:hypothetical protein